MFCESKCFFFFVLYVVLRWLCWVYVFCCVLMRKLVLVLVDVMRKYALVLLNLCKSMVCFVGC